MALQHNPANEQVLDFSDQGLTPGKVLSPHVEKVDYDSRPLEDSARRYIAYWLIGLLWVIIVSMLIMISAGVVKVNDIKEFSVVLGPIVTLVSAATGFYYGTKSVSKTN